MSKRKRIIYWIATAWLSLGMVSTGAVQLLGGKEGPGAVESMAHLGYPSYLLPFLGILKMLGAAAVLVPGCPLLKEWAYAGFFFLIAGAIYSHLACGDRAAEVFPAVLLLALIPVSWSLRPAHRKMAGTALK